MFCSVLATHLGHLRAVRVLLGVFRFSVANKNVANILAVVGAIHLGSIVLFLHGSLEAAITAFERLPLDLEMEGDFTPDVTY